MRPAQVMDERRGANPRLVVALWACATGASVAVMSASLLVLLGWTFDVSAFRSVALSFPPVNPGGTAIGLLLAGASLWLQLPRAGKACTDLTRFAVPHSGLGWWLAAGTVLLGAIRLVLYGLGWDAGPDQWLFPDKLNAYDPPNRMAPNCAFGLVLIGLALMTLEHETQKNRRPAQGFALLAAVLSLFTLMGYAYNASASNGPDAAIRMPLIAAVLLGILSVGVLFARPEQGLMSVLTNPGTGGDMARRMIPAAVALPAALAWVHWLGKQFGWYDATSGLSLFVVSIIVLFTSLVLWTATSLNRSDRARRLAEAALQQKTAILESVLDSMGDGVVVADQDGRFMIFNPVAERILGLGAMDVPPEQWTKEYGLFCPETGEPLSMEKIPLVRAIHGLSTDQQDLLIRSPNIPEGVYITVTGRPLRSAQGLAGGVVVFQDSTQRRQAANAIQRAKDVADAANRAKSEFLANMSHEIRTPLNAVIGMMELVLDTELSSMQRSSLKIAQDSAESLLMVINDILDFSKIEAGKLELDETSFPLRDLLGDAMKTLAVRARGKDLELALRVDGTVPEHLRGDPYRFRQVVTNLVSNAVKFTERGEVVLDVSAEPASATARSSDEVTNGHSADSIWLHVSVRDTGIGIPIDKRNRLFNAFSQVDSSTTRRYGGTGLGLAITARLVQLMGGKTWVDSEPGKGSTFHFTARFTRDPAPPPPALPPESLRGLRVLIVDDNSANRFILHEMLSNWEMLPVAVDSAHAALAELDRAVQTRQPYQLVLSDLHMPDVDGFELTARIRGHQHLRSMVILMLSSGAGSSDVARCRELGATAYLMKPVKQSELFDAIASALASSIKADVPPEPPPGDATRPLRILLAEDSFANQQLALGVLNKWGHSVCVACNGVEAVAAWEREEFDVVLMDVQMPEMDGQQATAAIREREQAREGHTPIIAMTAHAMKGDREQCLAAGMDDYISKPIRWQEVRRVLAGIAANRPCTDGGDGIPEVRDVEKRTLDWDEALRAVDFDAALLQQVLSAFLQEWPTLFDQLERAISAGDGPVVRRAAHTLRGSLRLFGTSSASEVAQQLEDLGRADNCTQAACLLPLFRSQSDLIRAEVKEYLEQNSRGVS